MHFACHYTPAPLGGAAKPPGRNEARGGRFKNNHISKEQRNRDTKSVNVIKTCLYNVVIKTCLYNVCVITGSRFVIFVGKVLLCLFRRSCAMLLATAIAAANAINRKLAGGSKKRRKGQPQVSV